MNVEVSKAFTREEGPGSESLSRAVPRRRPGEPRYVTPEGLHGLRRELEELRARHALFLRRPESERATLPDLERRIALVLGTLSTLTVLAPSAAPAGQAAFGTFVTVRDERGECATWRIVGPDEANPRLRRLSVHAPLAQALLGRRANDVVEVESPTGHRRYVVVEVRAEAPTP
jgi:transcription elongation factor GreB